MRLPTIAALAALVLAVSPVAAEDLVSADRPMPEVIDHYVAAKLAGSGHEPAGLAGDELLIRRTTLDLAGRIPTVAEVGEYVGSADRDKRTKLVDRLLGSPDFEFHQRNELDAMLSPDGKGSGEFREYLLTAVRENRPWDRMFREMMLPGDDPALRGAVGFLKDRVRDLDEATNDTSRLFFGVSINCAQCHDHPLVADWSQDHYFGLQTFFSRTYVTKSNRLAEKSAGEVKFKTTSGEEKVAAFMFLTGDTIEEPPTDRTPEQVKAEDEEVKRQMKEADAAPPSPPAFRPRERLVELALKPENRRFFSRSIVNRVWARLLGRGLVDPLDQLHSENPPSHPKLLDWLQRDLEANGYDLKRLIRGIVLSETYARSGRWGGEGEPPSDHEFGVFLPRPLSPRQYALSLVVAGRNPDILASDSTPDEWRKRREALEREAEGFAGRFELPAENFQVSVDEALFFSNNDRVQNDLLRDSDDRLIGSLKKLPDRDGQVASACRVVLSREPDAEERAALTGYLAGREDRSIDGLRQVVWALMTSPELRFNY